MCERCNVCMFIKTCTRHMFLYYILSIKNKTSKAKNNPRPNPFHDEVAALISELRVRRTAKPLMEMLSLKRQISLFQ